MKNKKLVVISTLLLSLGLTACGNDFPSFASYEPGDDGSFHHEFVPYDNGKRIETITLSENNVKLNINETKEYQINATFSPSDAANPYLYYLSNNPEIVSVNDSGKVSIITTGSASVSVFSDTGVTTDLKLEIYKPVEGISILPHIESDTGYVCDISETRQFAIGYTPNDTTQVGVTWSIVDSNDLKPGEVSIDANGLLTVDAAPGTKNASFIVKAISTYNESIYATEKVTVNDDRVYAESVAIYDGDTDVSDASVELTLGETLSLSAKTTPEETTAGKVYWESSNPTIATVDENGVVTALKAPATVDITASVDGHNAKVTVNTVKIDVDTVTLNETSLALTKGDTAELVATVSPDNASIKDVRFFVESGEQYVGVDQDGKVTARASTLGGEAVIKCVSIDNPEAVATCNVTVTNSVISIEVTSPVKFLHNGGEETDLGIAALPYDADPYSVTWISSDETIATVDASGHVTTNSSGLTGFVTFTATVDGTSISHAVTIEIIDPLPDFAWGIAGSKSEWVLDERAPFVESTPEGTALFTYKTEYEFEVGDEWKVLNTNGEWVYNNVGEVGIDLANSTMGSVSITESDRNISMNIAGTYEITLNIFDGAQKDDQGNFYSGVQIIAIGKDLPGQPKYAYVLNGGEPVELTQGVDPDGKPQLEALDIEMSAGSTLLFENIAPDTPEVLTSLVIGGDDPHGFTIDEGVLTASKDGTFNFYVKLAYGNDVVYISEKTVEPIYAYVLNNNDPVPLEEGTDPEGNPQLQVEGLVMSEGNTILFENIAPKTPEVLTSLTIGGDDAHGFTIDKGVLTSSKDGTFNFYVKLMYGGDVVYISESAGPEPEFMWGVASKSNSWALDTENPFVETTKEGDELYCYKITGYEFIANEEWKVKNTKNEWVANKEGVGFDLSRSTADAFSIADGNIKVLTAGTYDITLRIWNATKEGDDFVTGVQIYAVKQAGPGPTPVDPTSVSIDQDEPITVINGETTALTATLGPSGATGTLVWSSNNPDVISVDSATGVLTGKADSGTAVMTVSVDGFDDVTDSVTVTAAPVPEFAWALATSASDWKLDSSLKFTETDVPAGSDAKYAYTGEFTLDAELEFKVTNTNGEWVKNDTGVGFDSSKSTAGAFEVVNGNVVVKADDTYTFTLLIWEGAAKDGDDFISGVSFYAVGTIEPPTPEFAWALATSASDWKLDSSLKFSETEVPAGSDAKYTYTGEFTLDAELEFKVTNTNGEWVKNDTGVGFDLSKSTAGAFEVVNGNVVVKANDTYTFTLLIWEGAAKDGDDFISGVSFYAVKKETPSEPSISFGIADPKVDVGESLTIPVTLTACSEITYSCLTGNSYVEIDQSKSDDTKLVVNGLAKGTATIKALAGDGVTENTIDIECAEVVPVETNRYYIETKEWFNSGDPSEKVYVYTYKDGSNPIEQNAPFPGEEATYVKDLEEGKKLFYFDIEDTYDTFIVSKVVNSDKTYQTNDIVISDLEGDNCVYLKEQPATVETKVEVGHYNYQLGISQNASTISVGGSINLTITNSIGEVSYTVSPESSATVSITGNVATISSSTIGTSTITFSDESESSDVTFTLTVQEAPTTRRVYFETKSWFNSGAGNENVYAYTFKLGSNPMVENASFPGEAATWLKDLDNGKKIFYFDVSSEYDSIIFVKLVDGSPTCQTVDISLSAMSDNNCVYLASDTDESIARVGYYKLSV